MSTRVHPRDFECLALLCVAWLACAPCGAIAQTGEEPTEEQQAAVDEDFMTDDSVNGGGVVPDEPPPPEAGLPMTATLDVGIGTTQRVINFAVVDGQRTLDTGFVPALHLALGARFGDRTFFGVGMTYQSSVWAAVAQSAPNPRGPSLTTTIQSHHLSVGVQPGLRLGEARDSSSLSLFLGYGLRALASVVELRVPRYTLHGPVARLDFELPLFSAKVVLRVAPEAQLIVSQTSDLRLAARTQSVGFALGAEASVRFYVADWIALALSYRESHASVSSAWSSPFEDVERFAVIDAFMRYY
jgi:hypothetical protein